MTAPTLTGPELTDGVDAAELEVFLRVAGQISALPSDHPHLALARRATSALFKAAKKQRRAEKRDAISSWKNPSGRYFRSAPDACSRNASSSSVVRAVPMILRLSGSSASASRPYSEGRSMRAARSPVAPNSTRVEALSVIMLGIDAACAAQIT